MIEQVVIIGAGPAGMLAAGTLAPFVKKIYLVDKNKFPGKKLLICGKGRCNVTNACDVEDFIKNVPTNSKFLYSAFYSFTNDDIIKILRDNGVECKTERGNRVFPVSDNARDVRDALKKYAFCKNVTYMENEAVDIILKDGKAVGVKLINGKIDCDAVILATGGASYPKTGSDGSGYKLAKRLGHTIVTPKPSLIPIVCREKWISELMGLSLKNVEISVVNNKNKVIYTDFGEMLFTHFGLSGPIVLSASSHMRDIENNEYKIKIDLKPALSREKLDKRVMRDFEEFKNKHIINALDELLPKALIPLIIKLCEIDAHKEVNSITKEERTRLVDMIKGLWVTAVKFRPIEEAIITSGGVKTSEINSSTMESKIIENLFFAGEVIDVDAYTGGFNLQIAYSTGYLAAMGVKNKLKGENL